MLQLEPAATNLVSGDRWGCPATEVVVAEPITYGIIEFKNVHLHDEKKSDPSIARNDQSSVEEQRVVDVDRRADMAHHGSEDSVPLRSSPATSLAAAAVLASSPNLEPDGTLPFQVESGVEYDRGWIKYKHPESGEIWFRNEHTDDYFFAEYSRQWGWLPYESNPKP